MKNLIAILLFSLGSLVYSTNAEALCIGCGCNKAYNRCTSLGPAACDPNEPNCCATAKAACHSCGIGQISICVRFSIVQSPTGPMFSWGYVSPIQLNNNAVVKQYYFNLNELENQTIEVKDILNAELDQYRDIIDRYERGEELSEDDYERLP